MMGFLRDERGRIPLSMIGIIMILLSTAIMLFLINAEYKNVLTSVGQERERGLSDVMAWSSGDMETALNYAGMYALSTVGENPVINASSDYKIGDPNTDTGNHTADEVNQDRIRRLTLTRFTEYMDNNYDGSYYYGDYNVTVVPTGNASMVDIMPGVMTLSRMQLHPMKANDNYTVYYVVSVPTNVTIQQRGSDFNYSYDHNVTTMITTRYPLLQGLTSEYEGRMNGSDPTRPAPFFMDITAGSFAYTWAFGYTQYAYGEPLNIISTNNTELLVNGANLVEQGAVYNSVDPISLADLVLATLGKDQNLEQHNEYNMTNKSRQDLPENKTEEPPKTYNFTVEDMLDRAYSNLSCGVQVFGITTRSYMEASVRGSYTCKMHMQIERKNLGLDYNDTGPTRIDGPHWQGAGDVGDEGYAAGIETYNVYTNNTPTDYWSQKVTIMYIVDDTSILQYQVESDSELYPGGDYSTSTFTLTSTKNDVVRPNIYEVTPYDKVLGLDDPNAHYIVDNYKKSINYDSIINGILNHRGQSGIRYPDGFISGDRGQNRPPDWVLYKANDDIKSLRNEINATVHVTLDQEDYKDKPWTMTGEAYKQMQNQYNEGYDEWLNRDKYEVKSEAGEYQGLYYSCSAKAIYHIRHAFLDDVKAQLDYAAEHAGTDIQNTIDEQMKQNNMNMNSSDLAQNANRSNEYLNPYNEYTYPDSSLIIPFGLTMTLDSQREFDKNINYGWEENITLILDQKPAYLPMTRYTCSTINYDDYPIKTKNICLFSLPTDFINTDRISDAITGPVLDGIDSIAENAKDLNNRTVEEKAEWVTRNISETSKTEINKQIEAIVRADPQINSTLTQDDITRIVDNVYNKRNGNNTQIIRDLKDGSIQNEIANDLSSIARSKVQSSAEEYSDKYVDYMTNKAKDMVVRAEETAVTTVIDRFSNDIKKAFEDFTKQALKKAEKQALSAGMKKALGRIPNGLPLLPPWGWWATLNVWYIDVHGEVPYLAVYDTDTTIPNPIFGHEAQFYTRYNEDVYDENLTLIGRNKPISFQASTCTFIVVPPGTQGVGDKIGGWEEKSEGYDK